MVSVHTSPLEQPGTGDAGGMNVYVAEVAKELAARGVEVDIFTRATTGTIPPFVELVPGVSVRHITAGPYEGLGKADLPGQLCAFAAGVMRAAAARPEGWYDVLHSHYWLSGQVGWLAADRWGVPLVHTMHTMARVKNQHLPTDDSPEPPGREIGEAQVVEAADRLVANTEGEAADLVELYDADPTKVRVVTPGVDLATFTPRDPHTAREALGLPRDGRVLLFVGRIQPLKRPDVLLRVGAELLRRHPDWRDDLVLAVLGGPSGSGLARPGELEALAEQLGVADQARFVPPVSQAAAGRVVPRRRPRPHALAQRVVRPGGPRGRGLWHAGGRRRCRRAADGRRRHRAPGRGTRHRHLDRRPSSRSSSTPPGGATSGDGPPCTRRASAGARPRTTSSRCMRRRASCGPPRPWTLSPPSSRRRRRSSRERAPRDRRAAADAEATVRAYLDDAGIEWELGGAAR